MTRKNESGSLVPIVLNKNYAADLDFSIQYTRWFFTVLGIWPDVTTNSTRMARYIAKLIMPFPSTIISIVLIPQVSVPFFRDLTFTQYLLLIGPLIFRLSSVIKNLFLISSRDGIKFCIQHMENDWRNIENDEAREIMMRNLRVGRRLTVLCVICMYSGTLFYSIMPFVSPRKINSLNETIRPINIPGIEIYVDLRAGHNYEFALLSSWIVAFYADAIIATICNLAAVLVCHACGQIQIVMTKLENLAGNDEDTGHTGSFINEDTVKKRLAPIIRNHVRVLRFASKIDEVLREMCFIEVVAANLIICLAAYLSITERKNTGVVAQISYTILLISLSFNIFIFCRIGELLKEQCEAVGKAAYMTEWYNLPGKTGLALVMIITIANHPRKLTAGRIVELSIMTFANIMRTSFGYVNMLLTMND